MTGENVNGFINAVVGAVTLSFIAAIVAMIDLYFWRKPFEDSVKTRFESAEKKSMEMETHLENTDNNVLELNKILQEIRIDIGVIRGDQKAYTTDLKWIRGMVEKIVEDKIVGK